MAIIRTRLTRRRGEPRFGLVTHGLRRIIALASLAAFPSREGNACLRVDITRGELIDGAIRRSGMRHAAIAIARVDLPLGCDHAAIERVGLACAAIAFIGRAAMTMVERLPWVELDANNAALVIGPETRLLFHDALVNRRAMRRGNHHLTFSGFDNRQNAYRANNVKAGLRELRTIAQHGNVQTEMIMVDN